MEEQCTHPSKFIRRLGGSPVHWCARCGSVCKPGGGLVAVYGVPKDSLLALPGSSGWLTPGEHHGGVTPMSTGKGLAELGLGMADQDRTAFGALLELAEELRSYTKNWDWKYGEEWDEILEKMRAYYADAMRFKTAEDTDGTQRPGSD